MSRHSLANEVVTVLARQRHEGAAHQDELHLCACVRKNRFCFVVKTKEMKVESTDKQVEHRQSLRTHHSHLIH